MKSRNISIYDYLQALQQEWICLEIRSKIYVHKNDRDYFKSLMNKKQNNIVTLAQRNDLVTIFDDESEYLKVWNMIVPSTGLPNFIYNIVNVSDKQLTFPYKGTVIEVLGTDKYGITERVNFNDNTVTVMIDGQSCRYGYDDVRRLNHEDTDEFFYYYPNNYFRFFEGGKEKVAKLQSYNMKNKSAILNVEGTYITLQHDEIRRVL